MFGRLSPENIENILSQRDAGEILTSNQLQTLADYDKAEEECVDNNDPNIKILRARIQDLFKVK